MAVFRRARSRSAVMAMDFDYLVDSPADVLVDFNEMNMLLINWTILIEI